jgi:hypothetical protein
MGNFEGKAGISEMMVGSAAIGHCYVGGKGMSSGDPHQIARWA